jgi:hypothetical protein
MICGIIRYRSQSENNMIGPRIKERFDQTPLFNKLEILLGGELTKSLAPASCNRLRRTNQQKSNTELELRRQGVWFAAGGSNDWSLPHQFKSPGHDCQSKSVE